MFTDFDIPGVGSVLEGVQMSETLHARADTMTGFIAWCRKNGHIPLPLPDM